MSELEELAKAISICTNCPLNKGRTHAVPGEGPESAQVVFIGEGPGFREDQQGRPFVGPAGQFLEELLRSIGMERKDVYITNMVKCRPPDNRDPFPGEIEACKKWLDRQLELINPKVVVTLGRHSLTKFFPKESISRARGRARKINGITYFPMYHPAAALHQQSLRQTIQDDFKALPGLIALSDSNVPTPGASSESQDSEQLSMF